MAEKTISTRQKQKYDTSTNWTTNNIVLLAGEIGIESDTNKFKVGNGTSAWNELDYAGGGDLILYSTTGQNTDGAMTQKAVTDAIPTALSDLSEDSSHRTVTDAEKTTWNNKSNFSGSYNDLTNKPTIPTININGVAQSTINFDSDPQTQIDNIINNTTKIANGIQSNGIDGGFSAGTDSSATWGGAVGYSAVSEDGGSIGQHSQTTSGGAVGALTDSDTGFAGGHSSKSLDSGVAIGDTALAGYSSINQQYTGNKPITGVAIGSGAKTFIGVAIGYNAIAHAPEMNTGAGTPNVYDCIQLGTGTNNNSKTLQIYDDNIYNAETHKLGSALLDAIYPVGSIYMSVNSTNPSTLFGGTWEQFAQGRVLLGVGSNGETNYTTAEQTGGSENSVASHTHTQQEHNHTQQGHNHTLLSNTEKNSNANGFGANNKVYGVSGVWQDSAPAYQYYNVDNAGLSYVKLTRAINNPTTAVNNSTGEVGGNRMPFITCYIWKRTA